MIWLLILGILWACFWAAASIWDKRWEDEEERAEKKWIDYLADQKTVVRKRSRYSVSGIQKTR